MKRGTLVISLDFELVWGIFDHITLKDKVTYFDNTLNVIPQILELFEQNRVEVTWATVGMLFNENWEQWRHNQPELPPTYHNKKLDAYAYGLAQEKAGFDRFFFAPKLIKQLIKTPGQELATHTYSHYYCLEQGQTREQFAADLDKVIEVAQYVKTQPRSLVFPRNQWNPDYVLLCAERGITQLRSNPNTWFWNPAQNTLAHKIARTGDAYVPLSKMSYSEIETTPNGVTAQPASRFLRPQQKGKLFNNLRLQRIRNEMTLAARHGEIYHLWWHPHNFGNHPEASMITLKIILNHFQTLRETYGMTSKTMGSFAE
jgi:peptidoglycan/xylan/chitin deacetylase (PgdA/CDA1 family)